eukprot:TRINITY_DN39094_c2_g1_i1.p2 TRINITY_DN39094_c2_g1~~TRINITY_DN39094_c2_g1_i1.p2  ORF type:complete len:131 (-),score=0.62 TRINITY_DN39094_c2_g1_i1:513-905(-)
MASSFTSASDSQHILSPSSPIKTNGSDPSVSVCFFLSLFFLTDASSSSSSSHGCLGICAFPQRLLRNGRNELLDLRCRYNGSTWLLGNRSRRIQTTPQTQCFSCTSDSNSSTDSRSSYSIDACRYLPLLF